MPTPSYFHPCRSRYPAEHITDKQRAVSCNPNPVFSIHDFRKMVDRRAFQQQSASTWEQKGVFTQMSKLELRMNGELVVFGACLSFRVLAIRASPEEELKGQGRS